jgi:hypothetical protein
MKKSFAIFLVALSFPIMLSAQGMKDKLFQSWGYAVYSDFYASPIKRVSVYDPNAYDYNTGLYGATVTQYNQNKGFALMTFIYNLRLNLHEFSDNLALTVNTAPALGLTCIGTYLFNRWIWRI